MGSRRVRRFFDFFFAEDELLGLDEEPDELACGIEFRGLRDVAFAPGAASDTISNAATMVNDGIEVFNLAQRIFVLCRNPSGAQATRERRVCMRQR